MRIDTELVNRGIYASRARAARAIKEGCVTVNGKTVTKASFDVSENDLLEGKADPVPYVGRGAFKLKHALETFGISLSGKICGDIGASTGGFTEIMLQNGAKEVYAVDVGHGQLAEVLRNDPRVKNLEGTDVRSLVGNPGFKGVFEFVSVDVSFISLDRILPSLEYLTAENAVCVCLIKPQFEAGKEHLNKKGIVKSPEVRNRVTENFRKYAEKAFYTEEIIESPIEGGDGNREYLAMLRKRQ